ncbi:hypothetical protein [Yoonia sediminilitoris]|uniref:Uncharacterized protein n=1 Tax=Yoonia sediminilitoris TaxID=1286148 RepID=A0A2T6KQE0_9RHOB|nr:hypothetical protein [Yoonia sediminilitoris]PUB18777.1 hypothetical protein C8N45_101364 [Yoonia sediminilitoris]RCW98945.1 hypothetical protein DFP92_101364 [Yoonia sediminilitoris]
MFEADEHGVFARVAASTTRRLLGYSVLLFLGALLVYLPLSQPSSVLWTIFMVGLGALVFWLAERMRAGTRVALELTETELRESTGRVLARLDEIASVDRGAFSHKPSNGFTLILKSKKPRAWAPGLWWRLGRRVGVGGVTSAGEAKFMAEQISLRIASES